ncbi:MAG TPA: FHA domain-containing protein, partial [Ignavibacteriaceae bacterium]|nr:FHA domain-containing protein [Ignavibacteriaceae bacterium]
MILKISVVKQSDPSYLNNIELNRFPVFIGRDEKNEIILPDPFKVISRKHAKIIDTEGILQLIDLEAPNFTYLNDERLNPNEENAVKSGDKVKIGDYIIDLQLVKEKEQVPEDDQKTMVFVNPFAEEVAGIAENLKKLSEKFAFDNSPMKAEMLKFSLLQNLGDLKKDDMGKVIAEYFDETFLDKKPALNEKQIFKAPESKVYSAPKTEMNFNSSIPQDYSFNSHFTNTVDILLETFAKLIQGFLHFRQEFFGITIYHSLPTGSIKELKEFLFNPGISSEEEKKRLGLLKEEIQKLLSHQIGMLEGYRQSVTEGSKSLLESMDPGIIERDMNKNQQPS